MPARNRSNPGHGFGGPRYPGTFLLALREAFVRVNWQPRRWLSDAVECADGRGREQTLGLENLYRRVRSAERASWPDALAEFLAQIPDDAVAELPGALSEVADRILVRLGPPFSPRDPIGDVWCRPVVPGRMVATLVIDYPNSMSYVTSKMIADSDEEGTFWLDRALHNLRVSSPEGCLAMVHAESGLLQCEVADAYDSSRALILDHLCPGHEQDGFFVAVPGRDQLLVLPVSSDTLVSLPWLRSVAIRTNRNLPYPISPEVFWVRQGDWRHFAIELQGDKAFVDPPAEFVEILARLNPEGFRGGPAEAGDEPLPN